MTCLHDVFHVGLFEPFIVEPPSQSPVLPLTLNGAAVPTPELTLKAWLSRGVRQVLIQWSGLPSSAAYREYVDSFQQHYLTFQLVDKLLLERGGGGGMCGYTYGRRNKSKPATG